MKEKQYLDMRGEVINEGDTIETCVSSEWDSEVPRSETAIAEYDGGIFWAKSELTSDWYELSDPTSAFRANRWTIVKRATCACGGTKLPNHDFCKDCI